MPRPVSKLSITALQREELARFGSDQTTNRRIVRRINIILMRGSGLSQEAVARQLRVNRPVVSLWEKRFKELGLAGLTDAPGRGRKPSVSAAQRALIEARATAKAATQDRWTVRRMADEARVSVGTVHAIWKAKGITPHLGLGARADRVDDVPPCSWRLVGVYLRPPIKILAISRGERNVRTVRDNSHSTEILRAKELDVKQRKMFFATLARVEAAVFSQLAPRVDRASVLKFCRELARWHAESDIKLLLNELLPDLPFPVQVLSLSSGRIGLKQGEGLLESDGGFAFDSAGAAAIKTCAAEMEKWLASMGPESGGYTWHFGRQTTRVLARTD